MLAAVGGRRAGDIGHQVAGREKGHRVTTWTTFLANRRLFPTREQAQSAAGTCALVAESACKAWLFTLGPVGGSSAGGTKVAEVGPIPRFDAPQYLLRINAATGAPGSATPVHTHPGSETFFVLTGAQSVHTPDGMMVVKAGHAEPGHGPGMPMQVLSTGSTDLHALVMFVLDATNRFHLPQTYRERRRPRQRATSNTGSPHRGKP